ncbi:MAG: PAS domain S-box protein, partial [Casimicrobiaceae bacterium]
SDLHASEARYRELSELSADYYWEQDDEYRFTGLWSRSGLATVFAQETLLGCTRWDCPLIVNVSEAQWIAHRKVLDARLPFRDFIVWRLDTQGKPVCFSLSGHPVFAGSGAFTGYRGISRDVTAAKRDEQLLALEHIVTRRLSGAHDVPEALTSVMQIICETEGWECCRYLRVDERDQLLRPSAEWATQDEQIKQFVHDCNAMTYAPGFGLAGRAWQSGQAVWSVDSQNDARILRPVLAAKSGMRGAMAFPVMVAGTKLGVLVFNTRKVRAPDLRFQQAMNVIGSQVGQFLRRMQVEVEQREMRQLLDNIVDNIPSAVQLKSVQQDYRVVLWNKAAEAIYGVPRDEAVGHNVHELWSRADADAMDASDRALVASGGIQDFPDRAAPTRHKGTIRTHLRKLLLADASGTPAHLLAVADDITTELEDKARLRESEARFRSLTELSSDWYWEQDENLRFTSYAGGEETEAVLRAREGLGRTRWELPISGVSETQWQAHKAVLAAHRPFRDFEYQRSFEDGEPRNVSVSGHPVLDDKGRFRGYRGIGKDVTASKRAESVLRRFRAAMDLSADSVMLVDRQTMQFIDVNDGACRMLGYTREELLALGPSALIPPGKTSLDASYDAVIAGRLLVITTTHRRRDGTLVPVEIVRRAVHIDGRWIMVGIARDITDRLAAEEALRRSSERFDLVVRATNDVVWDWDLRSNELWRSENCHKVFGKSVEQNTADDATRTHRVHAADIGRVERGIRAAIRGRDHLWSDEYRFRCDDGHYVNVFDRGYVIRNADGKAVRMIGAMMDLTAQKQSEAALEQFAHRQQLLADLGRLALADMDADALMAQAMSVLRDALGFEYGKVLQLAPDGVGFIVRAQAGWAGETLDMQIA